jgi:hypothetical protein
MNPVPAVVVWQQTVQPVPPQLVYKFVYYRLGYISFLYLWRHVGGAREGACEVSFGAEHQNPSRLHGHWEVNNFAADGLPDGMTITFQFEADVRKPWYTKHFARQRDSQTWYLLNVRGDQAVVLAIVQ